MKIRVVITGMACITPIGIGVEQYWENSLLGKSGLKRIYQIKGLNIPEHMSQIVGSVEDFEPSSFDLNDKEIKYDRSVQFALAATKMALDNAKYKISPKDLVGVSVSTAIGNIETMENIVECWKNKDKKSYQKDFNYSNEMQKMFQFNNVADILAQKYNINGESTVLATGCTGGVDAMGYAFTQIREGLADVVLAGSTEAPITPLVISSFSKIGATSTNNSSPETASRPFDKSRDGFVLAEGCGMFILESYEHALKRNATILAEVLGYGSCSNALHMTDIPSNGEEIYNSMLLALKDGEIVPDEIDYVNLHGSSTIQNDIAETNALKQLFGDKYKKIPVTSNKSQIGHALSAANSIELVSSIMTLQTGIVPPTNNLIEKDFQCDLNVEKNARNIEGIKCVLKNSSGFSGIHSSIVIKKIEKRENNDSYYRY